MMLATGTALFFFIASTACYCLFLFFQRPVYHRAGYALLACGFISLTIAIGLGWIHVSGHIPVHNLSETLSLVAWAIAGVYLAFQYKFNLKVLGIFAAPLIVIILGTSLRMSEPLTGQSEYAALFNNFWLIFHVMAVLLGEAALALACGAGILYLIQERAIKQKKHGFFFRRLPSLDLLDSTGYGFIVVGFTLLTVGLITGFVYAHSVWGRFWGWDPKEVWSGITWLIYAALLHERLTVGWRGRKAAIMAIIGFAAVLFTFFGVNFLLKGHHGEFTRW
jgi:cytochrome c-type biogenesis protein CcsB